jgi:hypothetical protein
LISEFPKELFMATYTWVDLRHSEAALLADLHGIKADLESARDFALSWRGGGDSVWPALQWGEALSIAMVVKYSRPFRTGVRARLEEDALSLLDQRQREAHEYLLAYRDKHIAHSVNGYEHNQARLNYCVERVAEEGFTDVSCSHARVVGLNGQRMNDLVELCGVFLSDVEQRIEAERRRLLALFRAMPLGELLKAGQSGFSAERLGRVSERRKP